jgi:hypothetical protein
MSTDVTAEGGAGATFVDAPGAKLAVYSRGAMREDPVILLHGGPGVPDYLANVAELLAPRTSKRSEQRTATNGLACSAIPGEEPWPSFTRAATPSGWPRYSCATRA